MNGGTNTSGLNSTGTNNSLTSGGTVGTTGSGGC
jgi:hypothetical protein